MLDALFAARVFDLSQPFDTGSAARPGHSPFRMGSIHRHGDATGPTGTSATLELITMGTHTGTHMDALSHIAQDGKLFGGVQAQAAMDRGLFVELGVETVAPFVYRGVLLDVADMLGVDAVDPTHHVTASDLEAASKRQSVEVRPGDAVLIRLGWGDMAYYTSEAYQGVGTPIPGVDVTGAKWLVDHAVALSGTDTVAYEALAPGDPERPVHSSLICGAGTYIMENLALEELAKTGTSEFALIAAPLRFVGASGAPVRPLAFVSGSAS